MSEGAQIQDHDIPEDESAGSSWFWPIFGLRALIAIIAVGVTVVIIAGSFIEKQSDRINFLAVGIIGVATLAVAVVSAANGRKQWETMFWQENRMKEQVDTMRQQLKIMERNLNLYEETFYVSERAYLTISRVNVEQITLKPDVANPIHFTILNGGRTPSFNVRIEALLTGYDREIDEEMVQETEIKLQSPFNITNLLLAGQECTYTFTPSGSVEPDAQVGWSTGQIRMFAPIRLSYEDIHRDTQQLVYWYQIEATGTLTLRRPVVLKVLKDQKWK